MSAPAVTCAACVFWRAKPTASRGDCAKGVLTFPWFDQSCPEGRTANEDALPPAQVFDKQRGWKDHITGVKACD